MIKVRGSDVLHRSFFLGSLILSNVSSYPRLNNIHRHTAYLKTGVFSFLSNRDLPFSVISNSFHQQLAKQISSAVVTSDWIWV